MGLLALIKVNFLTWKAAWGKILTLNQINRRGSFLASHCCMCKSTKELVDHLLIHCGEAKGLWHFLFSSFSIWWVLPFSVKDLLICWNKSFVQKKWRNAQLTKNINSYMSLFYRSIHICISDQRMQRHKAIMAVPSRITQRYHTETYCFGNSQPVKWPHIRIILWRKIVMIPKRHCLKFGICFPSVHVSFRCASRFCRVGTLFS